MHELWDEPRPPGAAPRAWRDWVLVGVLIVLAVVEGVLRHSWPWPALLMPTLLWRRTHPFAMTAIGFGGAMAVILAFGPPILYTTAFFLVLLYALFRWGSGREVVAGVAVIAVKSAISVLYGGDNLAGVLVLLAVAAIGGAVRYRVADRAREMERVVLVERERLARDLHDTVAHHVSAMAVRAQAGIAVADLSADAPVEALKVIEAEAGRALDEMRAVVHALREPVDLLSLAGSGPPVVEVVGDVSAVPPAVATTVFRIAQEAVTNARRHAVDVTRVVVRVVVDDAVSLTVTDDGAVPTRRGAGHGLVGMAERARLLGGTCEAGHSGDGWVVRAVLPR